MSIERLPHNYPLFCSVRIGWRIGTVLAHIGKYYLVWWNSTSNPYGVT